MRPAGKNVALRLELISNILLPASRDGGQLNSHLYRESPSIHGLDPGPIGFGIDKTNQDDVFADALPTHRERCSTTVPGR